MRDCVVPFQKRKEMVSVDSEGLCSPISEEKGDDECCLPSCWQDRICHLVVYQTFMLVYMVALNAM